MAPKKVARDPPKKKEKEGSQSTSESTMDGMTPAEANEKIAVSDRLITCDICLEVMHNAMNVSPCNHKFCAGCIYEWHSQQKYCPTCRWYVQDITRDPMANELIEAYLAANPGRIRSDECKNHLDERELFHLEQYGRENSFSSLLDDTYDFGDSSSYSATGDTDQDMSDEEISDFGESDDSYSEAHDLEIKARRDIDAARIDRLRREKEERDRRKAEEEAALKKEKRKNRKRTNDRTGNAVSNLPVASRLRDRPPVNQPTRTSRRVRN